MVVSMTAYRDSRAQQRASRASGIVLEDEEFPGFAATVLLEDGPQRPELMVPALTCP
jgi:hypothetical protein